MRKIAAVTSTNQMLLMCTVQSVMLLNTVSWDWIHVCGCSFPGSSVAELSDVHDDRIHDENAQSKRQRRDNINSKLGTGPQPVLETLKYQVSIS